MQKTVGYVIRLPIAWKPCSYLGESGGEVPLARARLFVDRAEAEAVAARFEAAEVTPHERELPARVSVLESWEAARRALEDAEASLVDFKSHLERARAAASASNDQSPDEAAEELEGQITRAVEGLDLRSLAVLASRLSDSTRALLRARRDE